jgi:hypothetical protein
MLSNMSLSPSEYAIAAANELIKARYPQPDITQMLPFKPVRNACIKLNLKKLFIKPYVNTVLIY